MPESKNIKSFFIGLATLSAALFLFSCVKAPIYQESHLIAEEEWTYADSLTYSFDIIDTSSFYLLELELLHRDNYQFKNLYVQIRTQFPGGTQKIQPVSLELADVTGRWLGRCSGDKCRIDIPLQVDFKFAQQGLHQMTIHQYMRQSPIKGIQKISLVLNKSSDTKR